MTGDCHVRFYESRGVRFPPATHQSTHRAYRLDKHPRFHIPCTPTYSSRINQIERWFAELTRPLLERDYRRSVHALERDVRAGIIAWNQNPKPFVWTKTAEQILESLGTFN